MRTIVCFIVFLATMLTSCDENHLAVTQLQLVVEGWIEDGGYPVVIVTSSIPISEEYMPAETLSDYIVRWATVTVYCGEDSAVLTGKYDKGYFPPYIYTTSRMKGEQGKNYSLKVEYKDMVATATTTIPPRPDVMRFRLERCEDSDTMYQVKAVFTDNKEEKNYYQLFSKVGAENKQYLASYLGSIDDDVLGDTTEVAVYRGHEMLSTMDYTPYFRPNDTISVKLSQIDEASFHFWDDYIKILSLSSNPFMAPQRSIRYNIVNGFGYWCGMNSVKDYFVIPCK